MIENFLCNDKLTPEALPRIEALRHRYILKYRAIMTGAWRAIWDSVPKGGLFFGMHNNEMVCFDYDGYGIEHNNLKESDMTGKKFIRCIPEDHIPLYINSTFSQTKEAAINRFKGTPGFEPIPLRQDLVDEFYKWNSKIQRILKVIGYCDEVLLRHFRTLNEKIDHRYQHNDRVVTLCVNGRVYMWRDGKLLVKPETINWMFQVEDISEPSRVTTKDLYRLKLAVVNDTD
jgi:hypothetical protein